jgi:hypothetical protein
MTVVPSCSGKHKQEGCGSAGPGIKPDPVSKIANTKRAGGVAQVVECLLSKCKTLSSTISTTKTNQTQNPKPQNNQNFCLQCQVSIPDLLFFFKFFSPLFFSSEIKYKSIL